MKHVGPVLKKHSSFSILLLRNDSKVVRLRLNSFWVKFLIVFFAIFSGAAGAAGYSAHYYWKKYHTLQRERSVLAEKLGENRRQLGRFAGIERIQEAGLPRSSMSGVPSVATPPENGAISAHPVNNADPAIPTATQPPTGVATTEGTPAVGVAPPASNGPTTPAPTTPPPSSVAEPPTTANGITPQNPSPNGQVTGMGQVESKPDTQIHPALVDEVQIRPAGGAKYRLSFDLSNKDSQLTLNGRVTLAISTNSGDKHDITQVSRDTLRFLINRYKKITTVFALPADMPPTDVATLHITVTAENMPNVTYSFPIPQP